MASSTDIVKRCQTSTKHTKGTFVKNCSTRSPQLPMRLHLICKPLPPFPSPPTLQSIKSPVSCLTMATLTQQGKHKCGWLPSDESHCARICSRKQLHLTHLFHHPSFYRDQHCTHYCIIIIVVSRNVWTVQLLWNRCTAVNSLLIFPTLKQRMTNSRRTSTRSMKQPGGTIAEQKIHDPHKTEAGSVGYSLNGKP